MLSAPGKLDGRRIGSQKLLLGPGLCFLQEPGCLLAGAEQFQIHRFIVRRSQHPLPSPFLGIVCPADRKKIK